MKTKQTRILRAGATERKWKLGTTECQLFSDSVRKTLNLRFMIKSKGTGYTEIQPCIGVADFAEIKRLIELLETPINTGKPAP